MTCGVLLLAAGRSSRFGSDKRQVMINGEPMLLKTLANIRASGLPVLVCVQPNDTFVAGLEGQHLCCNNASQGMGATLAEGVSKLPNNWTSVLIALADMPYIKSSTYKAMAASLRANEIVVPVHKGQRGHPVGFVRKYFSQLMNLTGDIGAKNLVQANAHSVFDLLCNDTGILLDVDKPADIANKAV